MCSAVLSFEAVMMLLSILVLNGFSTLSVPVAASLGGGMAAACVVAIGGLGRTWGYGFGHVLQAAMVAMGALALPILFIGLLFAGLWVAAYVIGMKIDRDRAIR
jgi:hypothetical protein